MDKNMQSIFNSIKSSRIDIPSAKPHKAIMLLAIAKLYENGNIQGKKIFFSRELTDCFTSLFNRFARKNDRNRPYTPFFHLKSFSFWKLIPNNGKEAELESINTVGGPGKLNEIVNHVEISQDLFNILSDPILNKYIQSILLSKLDEYAKQDNGNRGNSTEYIEQIKHSVTKENLFVSYLNSLHCADANSNGALAESQAVNPLFAEIQIPHDWSGQIYGYLTGENPEIVILSGQAGDGKSTLALEIIKRIKNIPAGEPLTEGLRQRESLPVGGREIVVVKDLSEWNAEAREDFFREALRDGSRSYLVVSNTGTLLSLFRANAPMLGGTGVEVEDRLLEALDSPCGHDAVFGERRLRIFNLAQMDNIDFAMRLFTRMAQSSKWGDCDGCSHAAACAIRENVRLIQTYFERIAERLRLLLFRTYAYGERLTMRQLGALFAYALTGGHSCGTVAEAAAAGNPIPVEKAAFFNRLWGDDGVRRDERAAQLRAVRIIREQEFGATLSPAMEREFWRPVAPGSFPLAIPELDALFRRLLRTGRKAREDDNGAAARRQVRRMVFFLYAPAPDMEEKGRQFQNAFLNSPMLLNYQEWRRDPASFKDKEVREPLFRVLQEQFCGITPPDGPITDWELYITLNRYDRDIRQSAQIVLSHFKFTDKFRAVMENGELLLAGRDGFDAEGISLPLTLPFLDYIMYRKSGELGRGLQLSYRDRLQNLMADIIDKRASDDSDGLIILKQGANGQLATLKIREEGGMIEVNQ